MANGTGQSSHPRSKPTLFGLPARGSDTNAVLKALLPPSPKDPAGFSNQPAALARDHGPYLSVIIPAYNEEKRISRVLDAVYKYLSRQDYAWEVIVVVDGARDGTVAATIDFAAGKEGITCIDRKQNRGKGFTVRQGMLEAAGRVRLFTDADNSTDISHFDKMKPPFDSGYEVVICSRDAKDAAGARQADPQPLLKQVFG